ncbi:MAG: hypothetical protein ACRESW_02585 [Nevskiales bacterium]
MKNQLSILLFALAFGISGGSLFAQEEGREEGKTAPSVPDTEAAADDASETTVVKEVVQGKGDVLSMPEMPAEPAAPMSLPRRGMNMAEVERQFGSPASRDPAIGQPPIARWNYDGFSVFFENRTVLHAVQKDRPAEIYRKDELLPASSP